MPRDMKRKLPNRELVMQVKLAVMNATDRNPVIMIHKATLQKFLDLHEEHRLWRKALEHAELIQERKGFGDELKRTVEQLLRPTKPHYFDGIDEGLKELRAAKKKKR